MPPKDSEAFGRLVAVACVFAAVAARAQAPAEPAAGLSAAGWNLHGQATLIDQWHYGFPSPYEGPNSFSNAPEAKYTVSFSLFIGRQLWPGAELFFDPEFFQGYGLGRTVGIAGFPNGEAIRAGFPNLHYNTSRLFLRQTFGFGGGTEKTEDDANQFPEEADADRLVVTAGIFAANDLFDDNAYSHDPRTQFMNWALWESGAWDSPGDVLGFTGAAAVEWHTPGASWRYAAMMEPREANSNSLDPHIGKALGQILECDLRYSPGGLTGAVRPFIYWNRANMGLYSAADARSSPPDIAATRAYRSKEGFGLSWDQALTADIGVFARLSWNDGRTEDIAFSEIDRAAAAGLSLAGSRWGRPDDVLGLGGAVNGLSSSHRRYLEEGGAGFLLGDGRLNYGREEILESYYSFRVTKWLQVGPDFQYIEHPGYNRDRGGFAVYAIRAHVEY